MRPSQAHLVVSLSIRSQPALDHLCSICRLCLWLHLSLRLHLTQGNPTCTGGSFGATSESLGGIPCGQTKQCHFLKLGLWQWKRMVPHGPEERRGRPKLVTLAEASRVSKRAFHFPCALKCSVCVCVCETERERERERGRERREKQSCMSPPCAPSTTHFFCLPLFF
jgi:hypothetical protein